MKEKVIRSFIDKNTKKPYNQGSIYESEDEARIKELQEKGFLYKEQTVKSKENNGQGDKFPKNTGGNWYELSNGEKIQGEEKAIAAQKELDEKE
ncbi:hypothetical protein U472_09865 [Orenia metallireducens]|uniref:Uncharacterized protein n=1 Tax=Orenia metallireducens TaxID=1413210 RepID=A0A1C0A7T5_9FIRM|nr:hypothetical protein [Orenia metallireducens]OCL26306.1 hypothetical protein U472_09865 [Orenia metallireducens]